LLLRSGRLEEAETALRAALDLDARPGRALDSLLALLESQGRAADAVPVLERVARAPDAPESVRLRLAQAYFEAGRTADAIDVLEAAREAGPLSQEGVLLLGRFYLEADRHADALATLEPLAAQIEQSPELGRILGELSLRTGDAVRARTYFDRALAAAPDDYRNHIALFIASSDDFTKDGPRIALSDAEARRLLERASALAPAGDFDANLVLGIALSSVDSLEGARVHLERADSLRPGDRGAMFTLASVHEKRRDFAAAERILVHLHRDFPDDAAVSNFYGYLLAEMNKDLDRAEDLVMQALAQEPDNGFFRDSLGWVFFKRGEFERAVVELERAIEHTPDDAVILEHLGDAYAALARYKDALAAYRRSDRLQDGSAGLREKIESTEKRLH
jgi:tetratricopeptide (TPR) repeat protein